MSSVYPTPGLHDFLFDKLIQSGFIEGNARLIARAFNSHEALLEAAKDWLEYMDARGMDPEQREAVRKAIAQAEGKP